MLPWDPLWRLRHVGYPVSPRGYRGLPAFASLSMAGSASEVNFYPNDRINTGVPAPEPRVAEPPMPIEQEAWLGRFDTSDEDHYSQAGALFRLMSPAQQEQLCNNIAEGLVKATESVRQRMLQQFEKAEPGYAAGVAEALEKQHSEA